MKGRYKLWLPICTIGILYLSINYNYWILTLVLTPFVPSFLVANITGTILYLWALDDRKFTYFKSTSQDWKQELKLGDNFFWKWTYRLFILGYITWGICLINEWADEKL